VRELGPGHCLPRPRGCLIKPMALYTENLTPPPMHGSTARRSRRDQLGIPASGIGRQSVFRGPVQDPEVPPLIPRTLPRLGPGQDLQSSLLLFVQRRAPSWRHLHADPRTGPLRAGRARHRSKACRAQRRLSGVSRALCPRCAQAPAGARCRLDQSAQPVYSHAGHCSLIKLHACPISIDRFRFVYVNGTTCPSLRITSAE
jgi:hypothetical protein